MSCNLGLCNLGLEQTFRFTGRQRIDRHSNDRTRAASIARQRSPVAALRATATWTVRFPTARADSPGLGDESFLGEQSEGASREAHFISVMTTRERGRSNHRRIGGWQWTPFDR